MLVMGTLVQDDTTRGGNSLSDTYQLVYETLTSVWGRLLESKTLKLYFSAWFKVVKAVIHIIKVQLEITCWIDVLLKNQTTVGLFTSGICLY